MNASRLAWPAVGPSPCSSRDDCHPAPGGSGQRGRPDDLATRAPAPAAQVQPALAAAPAVDKDGQLFSAKAWTAEYTDYALPGLGEYDQSSFNRAWLERLKTLLGLAPARRERSHPAPADPMAEPTMKAVLTKYAQRPASFTAPVVQEYHRLDCTTPAACTPFWRSRAGNISGRTPQSWPRLPTIPASPVPLGRPLHKLARGQIAQHHRPGVAPGQDHPPCLIFRLPYRTVVTAVMVHCSACQGRGRSAGGGNTVSAPRETSRPEPSWHFARYTSVRY